MELHDFDDFVATELERIRKRTEIYDYREFTLAQMIKVSEEQGELADAILSMFSLQRKEKQEVFDTSNVKEEIADVIITAWLLAKSLDISVDQALEEKMEKIKKRDY